MMTVIMLITRAAYHPGNEHGSDDGVDAPTLSNGAALLSASVSMHRNRGASPAAAARIIWTYTCIDFRVMSAADNEEGVDAGTDAPALSKNETVALRSSALTFASVFMSAWILMFVTGAPHRRRRRLGIVYSYI